jgi:hypothetical protein
MKMEKMKLVETIPGMGGGRIKENDGGDEFNYDILLELFVNVTMYPQYNNKIIKIFFIIKIKKNIL